MKIKASYAWARQNGSLFPSEKYVVVRVSPAPIIIIESAPTMEEAERAADFMTKQEGRLGHGHVYKAYALEDIA